jgi:chaperonin cofactor prefoldin
MSASPDEQTLADRVENLERNVEWLNKQKADTDELLAHLVLTLKQLTDDRTLRSQLDGIRKQFANSEPFR